MGRREDVVSREDYVETGTRPTLLNLDLGELHYSRGEEDGVRCMRSEELTDGILSKGIS